MFKITHVITSIDINTGGPARSVTGLINSMLEHTGYKFSLYCRNSTSPIISSFNQAYARIYFCKYSPLFGFSDFNKKLLKDPPNLLHGHGLWQMPAHQMVKFARKNNIPYMFTTRGMLEPWTIYDKKVKKHIALNLYQRKDLKYAKCIHATASKELENIRKLGFKNPIAVIPNGINLAEYPILKKESNKEKQKLLFLSRIHPSKGIEILIKSWLVLDSTIRSKWQLSIVGDGQREYIDSIQKMINSYCLEDEIIIEGPKYGEEKLKWYQKADLFILPTYSENFGIVVAEALASGVPVITTKFAPWEDLIKTNSGWWIDLDIESIKKALTEALNTDSETLIKMGRNGRKLIEEKYSSESSAQKMKILYDWILGKGSKPDFVSLE